MSYRFKFIIFFLFISINIIACKSPTELKSTSLSLRYEMRETCIEFRLSSGELVYKNTLNYPYFIGDSATDKFLNQRYDDLIEQYTERNAEEQRAETWYENILLSGDGEKLPFSNDLFVSITYNEKGYISLHESRTMWTGGAHTYEDVFCITLSTENDIELTYSDFLNGSIEQIESELIGHGWEFYDVEKVISSPFALTEKGVCFYYNAGDYYPKEQIVIPYSTSDSPIISIL